MTRLALHWEILIGMIVGAVIGVSCNVWFGQRASHVPTENLPPGTKLISLVDTTDHVEITVTAEDDSVRRLLVDPTRLGEKNVYATVDQLAKKEPIIAQLFEHYGSSWARWIGNAAQRIGNLFLRLLQMVAIPLIVTSLISGVMGLGNTGQLGRMFGRTALYYVTTSMLAIVTGLLMVNLIQPGLGGTLNLAGGEAPEVSADLGSVLFGQLETMIPPNPFAALSEANFLSIICFSLAFAIFATLAGGPTAERLRDLFNDAFHVMMKMTMAIIGLAPLGVLFLMLYATATQGAAVFRLVHGDRALCPGHTRVGRPPLDREVRRPAQSIGVRARHEPCLTDRVQFRLQ